MGKKIEYLPLPILVGVCWGSKLKLAKTKKINYKCNVAKCAYGSEGE